MKTLRAHLMDNRGDENVSKMIWIVIVFIVGGIALAVITTSFSGPIKNWFNNTVTSWFNGENADADPIINVTP